MRSGAEWKGEDDSPVSTHGGAEFVKSGPSRKPAGTGRTGDAMLCNYCRGEGHWKDHCPLLKSKGKHNFPSHAPAMCCSAVSERKPSCVDLSICSGVAPDKVVCVDPNVGSSDSHPSR